MSVSTLLTKTIQRFMGLPPNGLIFAIIGVTVEFPNYLTFPCGTPQSPLRDKPTPSEQPSTTRGGPCTSATLGNVTATSPRRASSPRRCRRGLFRLRERCVSHKAAPTENTTLPGPAVNTAPVRPLTSTPADRCRPHRPPTAPTPPTADRADRRRCAKTGDKRSGTSATAVSEVGSHLLKRSKSRAVRYVVLGTARELCL